MMQTCLLSHTGQLKQPHAAALSSLSDLLFIQIDGISGFTISCTTHRKLTDDKFEMLTISSLASAGCVSRCGHALD